MSKISIVDENDQIIGSEEFEKVKKESIYRVSALWITNSSGEILLALRHRSKTHHPLKWGPAVAGTVEEGETYAQNIIKEAEEELGLEGISLKIGPKVKREGEYCHFTQFYTLEIDKDISEFKIQEDEVEEIKWFSKEELLRELEGNPENFTPGMLKYGKLFFG
jgi:isopentenyl-diphosphate delta-isomerase